MRRVNSLRAVVVPTTSLAGVVGPFAIGVPSEGEGMPLVCPSQSIYDHSLVLEFKGEENVNEQPLLTGLRPHLNLAAICERHILEQDGALTLFRVVDRFTIIGTAPEMPETDLNFTLVVSFRSGEFRGPLDLSVRIEAPSASAAPPQELSVILNFEAPEEKAAQMIGLLKVKVKEIGIYWIVVKLSGEEVTRIPFRVVYQRQPTVQTGN